MSRQVAGVEFTAVSPVPAHQPAWNNGQTSTFTFTATSVNGVGAEIVTLTGAITAGRFAGRSAVETMQVPALNLLQCAGNGSTSNTARVELEILPL